MKLCDSSRASRGSVVVLDTRPNRNFNRKMFSFYQDITKTTTTTTIRRIKFTHLVTLATCLRTPLITISVITLNINCVESCGNDDDETNELLYIDGLIKLFNSFDILFR